MLFKNKTYFIFVLIIIALCFDLTNAAKKKLTPEQQALRNKMKAERMKKSEAADKKIRHITPEEFNNTVLKDNDNIWVVFYGSKKCPHTQKFNPKWLQFQENLDNGQYDLENVKISKVECTGSQFKFCISQENQYWPELMIYYKGIKRGIYDGEDEVEDIVKFLTEERKKIFEEPIKTSKTVIDKSTKNLPDEIKSPKKLPPTFNNNIDDSVNNAIEEEEDVNNNIEDNIVDGEDNDVEDEEANNSNDIYGNEEQNNSISNPISENNDINTGASVENDNSQNQGSSKILPFSIGGGIICAIGFLLIKKKSKSEGYDRLGNSGYSRPSQMKYKYDKHIV